MQGFIPTYITGEFIYYVYAKNVSEAIMLAHMIKNGEWHEGYNKRNTKELHIGDNREKINSAYPTTVVEKPDTDVHIISGVRYFTIPKPH